MLQRHRIERIKRRARPTLWVVPQLAPQLLSINLRSNDVGYAGVVDLARAARAHGGVREMALGNNENVSDDAIRELEEVLRENRRNALVAELRDDEKKRTERSRFRTRRRSSRRFARRRRLRDEDAGTIAAALRPGGVADTLERLDLSDNELTAYGIDVLTHAIRGRRRQRQPDARLGGGQPGGAPRRRRRGSFGVDRERDASDRPAFVRRAVQGRLERRTFRK